MTNVRPKRYMFAALLLAALLGASCAGGSNAGTDFSCEELEREENVEFVLCDDGETRIDRRDEFVPATPQAEQ
jgi:hypothetical protein